MVELDVASLHENPHQPRRERDDPSLDELALSVAETGVQEPVKVRRADDRDGFYIVTGHRRTEAARRAGLLTVPARVLTGLDPLTERIVMLDENAMRQDLSVVDKAAAILAIVDHIPHGEKEGFYSRYKVSRPQIHKWRKLLELSEEIQNDVRRGYYTERHARAYWKLPTTAQEVLRARMLEDSPTSDTAVEMGRQVLAALYSAFGDEYMAAPAGEVAQAAAGALARLEPEPQPDESRKRHRADVPAFQRLFTLQRSLSLMSWQEVQEDRRRMNPLLDEIVLTGLKLRRQTGVGEMRPDEVRESRARAQELLDEAAAWLRETPDPDGPLSLSPISAASPVCRSRSVRLMMCPTGHIAGWEVPVGGRLPSAYPHDRGPPTRRTTRRLSGREKGACRRDTGNVRGCAPPARRG
ncbi:MAG: ParB/RepB/Spo0J family partition protein [Chloroflexia bacterium]